jgi:hypothetical protein
MMMEKIHRRHILLTSQSVLSAEHSSTINHHQQQQHQKIHNNIITVNIALSLTIPKLSIPILTIITKPLNLSRKRKKAKVRKPQ